MLFAGIVAATFMAAGCVLIAADTRVGRGATYAFYRWRRRQRTWEDHRMATIYEYWQHRATGTVWAVKLKDGKVVGATEIGRQDMHDELLPYLSYRPTDASQLDRRRDDFMRIGGRKAA